MLSSYTDKKTDLLYLNNPLPPRIRDSDRWQR